MWTLSSLQLHKHPMLVVDEDATLELQVKTVRYFKSIEKIATESGFRQVLPSVPTAVSRVMSPADGPPKGMANGGLSLASKENGLLAVPVKHELPRSPSPDIVPDSMHSRINEGSNAVAAALESGDLTIQPMGARIVAAH
jgi:glucosamine-6-phosphate deaminase